MLSRAKHFLTMLRVCKTETTHAGVTSSARVAAAARRFFCYNSALSIIIIALEAFE